VEADIRLNDISIDFETNSGHSTVTYDVNPSIISGVNELKIIIFPFFEKEEPYTQTDEFHLEAEVKAALYVHERGNDKDKELLTQIHLLPRLGLDQIAGKSLDIEGVGSVSIDRKNQPIVYPEKEFKNQITATRKSISVQKNYPRWAWQDGQTIEDTKENFDSLLDSYKLLYEAFRSEDRKKLLALHAPRSKEYAKAYYLGGIEEGHEFMSTGKVLDHPRAELYEFLLHRSKLDVFANGKMARIVNVANYHPVLFYEEETGLVHTMKFGFYKNQQGEWIMIR